MTIPLIRQHQCDSEGGRIRGVLLYQERTGEKDGKPGGKTLVKNIWKVWGERERERGQYGKRGTEGGRDDRTKWKKDIQYHSDDPR